MCVTSVYNKCNVFVFLQDELNNVVLKDMRSNKEGITQTVLNVQTCFKESMSVLFN